MLQTVMFGTAQALCKKCIEMPCCFFFDSHGFVHQKNGGPQCQGILEGLERYIANVKHKGT